MTDKLPPLPEPDSYCTHKDAHEYDVWNAEQMRAYAEEAAMLERDRLKLPKSYAGSTFGSWGDQKDGCTVRIHFTDAKEAEQWFNRLTEDWGGYRSK